MAQNATIKGGGVMRSISRNARRATQDLDLDFIRYSISDNSIYRFVEKLNCISGLVIKLDGKITELNHQDYKGKRNIFRCPKILNLIKKGKKTERDGIVSYTIGDSSFKYDSSVGITNKVKQKKKN